MRQAFVCAALLLSGCVVSQGQKVTVLLLDETIPCEGANPDPTATLALDQADDLYQVQVKEVDTGKVYTLAGVREGLQVTFTCPAGFTELLVRHGTILQERVNSQGTSGTASNGDGRTAP